MYATIYFYLTKIYFKSLAMIYGILLSLLFIMQLPSNLKLSKQSESFFSVIITTLLQLPQLAIDLAPLVVLFASFFSFKNINNSNEFIIFKSIGISIWKTLAPFLINTLIFYLAIIFIFSYLNISSINYLNASKTNSNSEGQAVSVYEKDIWIVDRSAANKQTIIYTNNLSRKNNNLILGKAIIFRIENHQLVSLINAQYGTIIDDKLLLEKITLKESKNPIPINLETMVLDFKVKINKFNNFNLIPQQTYVWRLVSIIKYLDQTSLNSLEFKVYLYNQLTLPIFMFTLILISAYFAFSNSRAQSSILQTIFTIVSGCLLYFGFNFFSSLSYTGFISPIIGIIVLKILFLLIAFNLLLFKEGI